MSIALSSSDCQPHGDLAQRSTARREEVRAGRLGESPAPWPARIVRIKDGIGNAIRGLARSSWVKFTTGVVLLSSGLEEAIETLSADLSAFDLGPHHGLVMLGFLNILSALPDMLDGLFGTFLVEASGADDGVDGGYTDRDEFNGAETPAILPLTGLACGLRSQNNTPPAKRAVAQGSS